MKAERAKRRRLRFESFELDIDTCELLKNGRKIRLQDQPARLLALLASRPNELVTRTEIQKELWEDGRFVEFDTAVNTAIKKIREALEDDSENPRLVETLPRKGYRFIATLKELDEQADMFEPSVVESVTTAVVAKETEIVLDENPPSAPVRVESVMDPPYSELRPQPMAPAPGRSWPWTHLAIPIVAALLGFVLALQFREPVPAPAPELRLEITTPPTADPTSLAISPDGLKIVFVAISEGRSQLRLRSLDTGTEQSLAGTDGALFPFWSPNSRSIGFFADGALKRTDIDGGLTRTLAEAPNGRGGTWNNTDVILFTPNAGGAIFRVSAAGDTPAAPLTMVTAGSHRHPSFLPDNRHFLYYVTGSGADRGIYVGDLDGADAPKRLVVQADAAGEYTSGQLLFVSQGVLFAQAFDATRQALSGEPSRVAGQVTIDAAMNRAALSASTAGSLVYRTGSGGGQRQFLWYDSNGREIERVGEPDSSGVLGPSLSSDGRHVAMYRTVDGNSDVWLLELERGVRERFTLDGAGDVNPVWSPDLHRIAFSSNRDGAYDLYVKAIGATETELLLKTEDPKSASSWSPDGKHLLYRSASPKTGYDIWALPFDSLKKPGDPFVVVQTEEEEREAEFSPNGKWIAYQSNTTGRSEVYVQPFPAVADAILLPVSTNGGAQPRWGSESELYYIALDGQLMKVPIRYSADNREIRPDRPTALFPTAVGGAVHSNDRQQYVVSPDGKRFLMNTLTEASSPVTVILNWKGSK
jgi:Tol biopolymer transport system component/DNA-binding winged helix-turn-helix (wHTH) protein